ncbi:MAG: CPBP family intramembrane glutamic endopeptidase [Candidatus Sulfotelmatobacter sp.]
MGTQRRVEPPNNDAALAKEVEDVNSKSALIKRMDQGRLTWSGPLLLVMGRSVLIIAAQAVTAGWLWLRFGSWSWNAAAKWWTVYGTLVDVGCLSLMAVYTRKEGIRLRDLIGRVRFRWGRDLFLGAGVLLLVFPFFGLAVPVASRLVWGTMQPQLYPGLLAGRALPLWGVIYSLSVWWPIWSATEEITYQGYALPRLEVLFRSQWKAVAVVGFWWALQHAFIPFIFDWKYIAWRFLAFLPGVVVFTLLYLRVRRLSPFIVAHWPMDIYAVLLTLKF